MVLVNLENYDIVPFPFLKKLLSLNGMWPLLTPFQVFVRTVFINVCLITLYSAQIITIVTMEFEIETNLKLIAYLSTTTCLGIAYYSGLFNRQAAFRIINMIIDDYIDLKGTKEYEVLMKYCSLSKFGIMMFIVSYLLYISLGFLFACKPFILDIVLPLNETRQRILLYSVDWLTKDQKYFMKILLFQYFLLVVLGISAITNLSTYLLLLQHVCAMFRIIGCLLDNILEDKDKQLRMLDDHVVYAKIIRIIGFHSRTIELMDLINAKFDTAYLLVVSCALCFTGICIVQLLQEKEKLGLGLLAKPIMLYTLNHLVWVFVFCYIGQHLEDISSTVFDKTYATPWYLMSKRSKVLLLFMIARASKPSYISIGKLFTASHEFYTGLLRLAISSGTVLYSLN